MKISNSQIASLQKCGKRFEFEHLYQIRPTVLPEPLERGIAGHDMLEQGLLAYKATGDYDSAVAAVNECLSQKYLTTPFVNIYRHVIAFLAWVDQQKLRVVEVEVNHSYRLSEDIEFVFTPDCIFEFTQGLKRGKRLMVDFKFTGQYWSDREVDVYQQIPKYIRYWNLSFPEETPVTYGAVIMLNTRAAQSATGSNLFKVAWLELNKRKLDRIQFENELLINDVFAARSNALPLMRSVDTYGCKMCPFAEDICPMELNGHEIESTIKANYEKNTYFEENYGEGEGGAK